MLRKLSEVFRLQIAKKEQTNCFELFGCDILLDACLHMHLLEVNMAARCQERHPSLTAMLEDMGHGILNILEDKEGKEGKEEDKEEVKKGRQEEDKEEVKGRQEDEDKEGPALRGWVKVQ